MIGDKFLKQFSIFLGLVVIISLVINFILLSKINQLTLDISNIWSEQQNISSNVNNQADHIESVLNDINEQQSWISAINMDIDTKNIKRGQAGVTFEWQVKELQRDSKVVFNYMYGDGEDYVAVPAKEIQQGLFQVKIPFEVKLGPQWEAWVSGEVNREITHNKEIVGETMQNTIRYFVSVSYGDMVKSGEMQTEDLGYLGASAYGNVQADIDLQEDHFNVFLSNRNESRPSFTVENAYLLKYENDKLIEEIEFESNNEDSQGQPEPGYRYFYLTQMKEYDGMRLIVKVIYHNGDTFEREVY